MAHMTMLLTSYWQKLTQIVMGLFAIVPQTIYFLYASMASLMDFLQLCVRKLAGLDVYYINGQAVEGDILKDFFEGILGINKNYGALNTVFWALVIFGCIVLVLSTIFAIIKSHYDTNYENTNPWKIIVKAVRALCLMVIVPIVTVFGIRLCEIFLQTLDSITSGENISTVYEQPEDEFDTGAIGNFKYETSSSGKVYYSSYDMFGVTEWTSTITFSGMLFDLICMNANRVRFGDYTATNTVSNSNWDNCNVFYANTDNVKEDVANQIDYAFKNCLTLNNAHDINIKGEECKVIIGSSLTIGPSVLFRAGLNDVTHFSKFNVGLVWYYYNLWGANYFLGFAGVIALLIVLFNLIFGLIKRILICVTLFLVAAPVIGISPLDDGNGIKSWTKTFISYLIACFGAIIGMNLFFLILPALLNISFFNNVFLDKIFNMIIIIAGMTMVKSFISMISSFIGSADLQSEGAALKGDVEKFAMKGLQGVMAAGNLAAGAFKYATGGGSVTSKTTGKFAKSVASKIKTKAQSVGTKIKTSISNTKEKMANNKAILKDAWGSMRTRFMTVDEAREYREKKEEKANNKAIRSSTYATLKNHFTTMDPDKKVRRQEKLARFSTAVSTGVGKIFSSPGKDGNPKKVGFGAIKDYLLDLGGGIYQTIGEPTGIKAAIGALVKEGINDQFKEIVQGFAPQGMTTKMKAGEMGKHFQTKSQKEKEDSKKAEENDRLYQKMANNSKQTADKIATLTKSIGDKLGPIEDAAKGTKRYDELSEDEQRRLVDKLKNMGFRGGTNG